LPVAGGTKDKIACRINCDYCGKEINVPETHYRYTCPHCGQEAARLGRRTSAREKRFAQILKWSGRLLVTFALLLYLLMRIETALPPRGAHALWILAVSILGASIGLYHIGHVFLYGRWALIYPFEGLEHLSPPRLRAVLRNLLFTAVLPAAALLLIGELVF